jgi:thioredoxin-dependent peroxiredoxin
LTAQRAGRVFPVLTFAICATTQRAECGDSSLSKGRLATVEDIAREGRLARPNYGARPRKEAGMTLTINDTAPDFTAQTTDGEIQFHEWIGDSWTVLFSHPKDFTPVCTTELGYMAKIKPEFDRRNVKIIGLSVDTTGDHEGWSRDIEETQGTAPNYPIIGDSDFKVSKLYGMLPDEIGGEAADRTAADNQTVRNVFVIGPDKKVKLVLVYPMTTGRNFDEVLRVIDSLQLTAKHRVSTPVNWQQGDKVIIAGSVTNDEAKEIWPDGWESPKPYIRIVDQPESAVLAETTS